MLTIRNQERAVELPAIVQQRGRDEFWLAGMLRVRQSDFGIRPESIGGVVKVADVVDIHVGLLVIVTSGQC
jgi:polyisoprenoid-binding protein YceI